MHLVIGVILIPEQEDIGGGLLLGGGGFPLGGDRLPNDDLTKLQHKSQPPGPCEDHQQQPAHGHQPRHTVRHHAGAPPPRGVSRAEKSAEAFPDQKCRLIMFPNVRKS